MPYSYLLLPNCSGIQLCYVFLYPFNLRNFKIAEIRKIFPVGFNSIFKRYFVSVYHAAGCNIYFGSCHLDFTYPDNTHIKGRKETTPKIIARCSVAF